MCIRDRRKGQPGPSPDSSPVHRACRGVRRPFLGFVANRLPLVAPAANFAHATTCYPRHDERDREAVSSEGEQMDHNDRTKRTPMGRSVSEPPGRIDRRTFLARGAAVAGVAASAGLAPGANAQGLAGQPWERVYGTAFTGYGQPSRFELPVVRHFLRPYGDLAPGTGAALTPIESLEGIITPSSLHNTRSHSGTPDIDPKQHQLLLHGLVARPLAISMESLWRYPMTTRTYFIECSGNSLRALLPQPAQIPAGAIHGNISCSEWTGVSLRMLLEEAGLQPQSVLLLAECADSARMSRSIPLEKALEDAMIALFQNGERLRPEQG